MAHFETFIFQNSVIPNREFAEVASDEQIERTAKALEANGIHTPAL